METTLDTNLGESLDNIEKRATVDEALAVKPEPVLNDDGTEKKPLTPESALEDCTMMIEFAYESLQPLYPAFEKIYTPEKRTKLAAAFVPICVKYGWDIQFLQNWPWLGLIIVGVPLIKPTYDAIKLGDTPAQNVINQHETMQPIIDRTDANSLHNKA